MATIQELFGRYETIETEVKALKKEIRGNTGKKIRETKAELDDVSARLDSAMETITILEAAKKISTLSKDQEKQLADAINEKNTLSSEKEALKISYEKMTNGLTEAKLEQLKDEQEKIITEFAMDPDINKYLVDRTKAEFAKKISVQETAIKDMSNKQDKFNLGLLDTAVLGNEAKELASAYEELQKLNPYSTDAQESLNYKLAHARYLDAAKSLRTAVDSNAELNGITISDEQLKMIAEGPVSGKYEVPVLEDQVTKAQTEKDKIEQFQIETIERLEAAKTLSTSSADLTKIEEDIKTKDQEIKDNATALASKKDEVTKAQAALDAIANNATRLQELKDKSKVDPAMDKAIADAEAEVKKYEDIAKNKGYISSAILPGLKDDTKGIGKVYKMFETADLDLRKAFLRVQGENTPESKENLKQAINRYQQIAEALSSHTGYKVSDWNDYLQRRLNDRIEDGETIDEAYYESTSLKRLEAMKKDYKLDDKNPEYAELLKSVEQMEKVKQQILRGKKVDEKDIDTMLDTFNSKMKDLADSLKENIANLFNKMKTTAIAKVGIFKKLFNNIFRKAEMLPEREYDDDTIDAVNQLNSKKGARAKYEAAQKAKNEAVSKKLTDKEKAELKGLEQEAAKKSTYEQQKTDAEAEVQKLTDNELKLVAEKTKLEEDKTKVGSGVKITDTYNMAVNGKAANRLAKKVIEHAKERDFER